jgi:hypothetical protein
MEIDRKILGEAPEAQVRAVLAQLLTQYLTPAFGVLPKPEIDLAMLNALQQLGLVSAEPAIYELVAQLRVTRAKARNLIYACELRRTTAPELDARLKQLLRAPALLKNGELFALEVENPLLSDHLKARLQQLGHASDGSFSPSLVTLKLDAMVALLASCLSADEQEKIRKALVKAGAPDTSLRGLLTSALKKLGAKLAAGAGEAAAEQVSDYLGPLLDAAIKPAADKLGSLINKVGG